MTLDPTWLFASLITSGIGLVLFAYGRKQQRSPHLVAGVLFMVYPYFTPGLPWLLAVGALIGLASWGAVRQGW